jgi:hypothetical protein
VLAGAIWGGGGYKCVHICYVQWNRFKAGSLKMNTALEYSTRVVQEGGR